MCLDVNKGKPEKTSGFGWKVLRRTYSGLESMCYSDYREIWTTEWKNARVITGEYGFHIYLTEDGAQKVLKTAYLYSGSHRDELVLVRVEYMEARLWGYGDGGWDYSAPVVVAMKARLAP